MPAKTFIKVVSRLTLPMALQNRAQTGAAILVALIAVLIIFYVLFLPPAERAALLGAGTPGQTPGGGGGTTGPALLFSAPVGRVYLPGTPAISHDMPSFTIRTSESGNVLAKADTIVARNNAFEKQPATLSFAADPALTRNAVLSMNLVSKSAGNIVIYLNDLVIFNQDVRTRSVPPINLENLQSSNTLRFEASSVGFAFWKTNTYTLTNVKITGDVTDVSGSMSRQVFALGQEEFATLERAQLSFVPMCFRAGSLRILVNGVEVFGGSPDCGGVNTLELAPARLVAGENVVQFLTSDGDFLIDRGLVQTQSKQQQNRVFRFSVDPASVQGKQINARILFADTASHSGTLILNGNTIPIRAQDALQLPITVYVRPGENTFSFEAIGKDFEIVKVDILAG
jgi:hypothetical protein